MYLRYKILSSLIFIQLLFCTSIHAKQRIYYSKIKQLGVTKGELLCDISFIDSIEDQEQSYFPKQDTGLPHTIEYDPETDNYFIVLEDDSAYIDSGVKKVVNKALWYNGKKVKVVARAEQTIELDKELELTKSFRNTPGVFKNLGFCTHKEDGIQHYSLYSKLYSPGSFQQLFNGKYRLLFKEKVKISLGIIKGLVQLHTKGIVHRDLGIKNYLIHIKPGKPGKRTVKGRIADFGRASLVADITPCERLQGDTTYVSPEGHFCEELSGEDYYKVDIFAVGCVFYRLFYGKKAPWQDRSYVHDKRARYERFEEHSEQILKATVKRRKALRNMQKRSPKQEFEYVILRMLETAPEERIDAKKASKAIRAISRRVN